jgi:hypothetical protein
MQRDGLMEHWSVGKMGLAESNLIFMGGTEQKI